MPSLRKGLSLLKKNRVGEISFGRETDEVQKVGLFRRRSRGSPVTAEEASILAKALKTNTSVSVLYLRGSCIGDQGAISLAEALEQNTSLEEIDLSENGIGDIGAVRLAEALEKNTTLRELHLSGNRIGTVGAVRFAQCLEKNTSLRIVSLLYNVIEPEGITRLVEAVEANHSLRGIMLSYIKVDGEATSRVHDATSRNRLNRRAADLLSLVVFVADGHLKVREPPSSPMSRLKRRKSHQPELSIPEANTSRFFGIMKRLPFDIQMIICSRMAELKSDYVTYKFVDPALQDVARMVSRTPKF